MAKKGTDNSGDRQRALLIALLPAVNGIHGGCVVCLEHFAERANAALSEHVVPYRYHVARQADNANLGTVTLETTE